MKRQAIQLQSFVLSTLFLIPFAVFAHTGVGEISGFSVGFIHPFSGWDHLLAMVAVGLWATQMKGRAIWVIPGVFVGVMTLGGLLGISGIRVPYPELGILVSVLVLGILIVMAMQLPLVASAVLIGLFALFHGHAHGAEMPLLSSGVTYSLGFALATALLHLSGIAVGLLLQKQQAHKWVRFTGAAIAMGGIYLAIS